MEDSNRLMHFEVLIKYKRNIQLFERYFYLRKICKKF